MMFTDVVSHSNPVVELHVITNAIPIVSFSIVTNAVPMIETDISTNVIGRVIGSQLPFPNSVHTNPPEAVPVSVTIISPLVDADTLDLSSSARSQSEFALAMSFALRYAGLGAQANAFEQFVKNKQFDIRTATSEIAVNAYSGTDGKFGFEVGPRLQALGQPAKGTGKSAEILTRQSFPALLILALDAADMVPILYQNDEMKRDGKIRVLEPQIRFTQMRRWTPLKKVGVLQDAISRFFKGFPPYFDATEEWRLRTAMALNSARQLCINSNNANIFSSEATNAILKRISNLEAQMVGGEGALFLSVNGLFPVPTNSPVFADVTNAIPANIVVEAPPTNVPITIAFLGSGLDQIDRNSTVSNIIESPGVTTQTTAIKRLGQMLQLDATLSIANRTNDFDLVFKLHTTNKTAQTVLTYPVRVKIAAVQPVKPPEVAFSITNASASNSYRLSLSTNAGDALVGVARDLIKADLEKSKPGEPSNTVISVSVNKKAWPSLGTQPERK
jgi:hypothetical protein